MARLFSYALALAVGVVAVAAAAPIDWSGVDAAVDAFEPYAACAVFVGNASGTLHVYAKGGFDVRAATLVASASKWVAASVVQRVIELTAGSARPLTYASRPVDWLPEWAALPADDPRQAVTLQMLLSFTDGMSRTPCSEPGTTSDYTWDECQQATVDLFTPLPYAPNSTFFYSGAHLHVAGYMAAVAAGYRGGTAWNQLYRDVVADRYNFTTPTFFTPPPNPMVAGGMYALPADYATWLQAYFTGELFDAPEAAWAQIEVDYTPEPAIAFAYSPLQGYTWHYGAGHWLECRANSTSSKGDGSAELCNSRACESGRLPSFEAACSRGCEQSSIGAFGFYPYIDRCFGRADGVTDGYWAIVAVDTGDGDTSSLFGNTLWPAVREAFLTQLQA